MGIGEQKMLLQQLFTSNKRSGTSRNNYLLISIFEKMLDFELTAKGENQEGEIVPLSEVQLTDSKGEPKEGKEMITPFIFELIFESQPTNMDTICCIACHIINNVLSTFQASQSGGGQDTSLDVEGKGNKAEGGGAGQKQGGKGGKAGGGSNSSGGSSIQKRAQDLFDFLKSIIEAILNNQILKESAQYFALKKQTHNQLEYIKKQFKFY